MRELYRQLTQGAFDENKTNAAFKENMIQFTNRLKETFPEFDPAKQAKNKVKRLDDVDFE